MKLLLITLSLAMSFQLHARHRVGNGGDAVVCQNGSVQTVELLDSYESREIYGNELKLPAGKNELEVALALIERMKDVAPGRHQMLAQYVKNFAAEAKFVDWNLEDVPDHGFIKLPAYCQIKQLIVNQCQADNDLFFLWPNPYISLPVLKDRVQKWPDLCKGRYRIDERYWRELSIEQKALAMVHEAFMRDYRQMGDPNFKFNGPFHPVRYFNILLFSDQISEYDYESFQRLYASLGRLSVVRELKDGRIVLNQEGSLVVPHVGIQFISYLNSVMEGPVIVLNSPELVVGEEEIHFSTVTHITIKKNNYNQETWDVTGKIRARKGIFSDHFKEHFLVIDALLSYEFPGFWGQGYFTGWEKSIWCLEEDEPQPRTVRILNLDYTDYYEHNDTQVISYDLAEAVRLTNDFMNVFIESGTSVRDNRASQTSCETNSYAAKSMSFKASGDVKTADGWVKVRDDLIFVDFVKKEVSVLGY